MAYDPAYLLAKAVATEINSKSVGVSASVVNNTVVLTAKDISDNSYSSAQFVDADTKLGTASAFIKENKGLKLIGNEGDTYFQRWDSVKTIPNSDDDDNQVFDAASVMIETHINLDGRTDLDRGTQKLASVDYTQFGSLNTVYSQADNYLASVDYDEQFNADSYPSSITWTQQKSANADIDEWMHITLASSLALDGDKGKVQALRRFNNSIVAFQDKGIAEVLFNSRTQLSTTEGVPVEIANSGKVEGKRYISNKYGTTNKWSIVEGKAGIYFVDALSKAFCQWDGSSTIKSLSDSLGFSTWFKRLNTTDAWEPKWFDKDTVLALYDKVRSEVYLVTGREGEQEDAPCLVYNELLGTFTSFYDYSKMSLLVNLENRLIGGQGHTLYFQNEGYYGDFFGSIFPYSVTFRATPNPYSEKIWTNLDYRADAYRVLDDNGNLTVREQELITGDETICQHEETFSKITVWNEYQTTGTVNAKPVKKFRTWRWAIPRAAKTGTNKYGLDRIRNPWIFIKLQAETDKKDLMQIHDVTVKYFE